MAQGGKKKSDLIDKESWTPVYAQLAAVVRRRIADETYPPGSRLPAESALAKSFGVSPMTARQAIGVLAQEGLVRRVQGSGTFVRRIEVSKTSFTLGSMREVFADLENLEVKILKAAIEKPGGKAAQLLKTKEGDRLVAVERLIRHRGLPFAHQVAYARFDPTAPILEKMLDTSVLTEYIFEENHPGFKKGILELYPEVLDDRLAGLLGEEAGVCAFRLEHLFFDFNDRAAAFGAFVVSANRMRLTSRVGVWDG